MTKTYPIGPALKAVSLSALGALALAASAAQAGDRSPGQGQSASGIWVASGDVDGDGRPDAARRGKVVQNGTTVGTAAELQAPPAGGQAGLLLPAVQKVRPASSTQRAKLKQNGTTVATAGEVQAPGTKPRAGLLLPAVQKARMQPQPQRGRLQQNGTTVATPSTVTAPSPRN